MLPLLLLLPVWWTGGWSLLLSSSSPLLISVSSLFHLSVCMLHPLLLFPFLSLSLHPPLSVRSGFKVHFPVLTCYFLFLLHSFLCSLIALRIEPISSFHPILTHSLSLLSFPSFIFFFLWSLFPWRWDRYFTHLFSSVSSTVSFKVCFLFPTHPPLCLTISLPPTVAVPRPPARPRALINYDIVSLS